MSLRKPPPEILFIVANGVSLSTKVRRRNFFIRRQKRSRWSKAAVQENEDAYETAISRKNELCDRRRANARRCTCQRSRAAASTSTSGRRWKTKGSEASYARTQIRRCKRSPSSLRDCRQG